MKIIRGFENLPSFPKNTIVALGNFDGVHLGHKRILEFVTEKAKELDLVSMVLTFSPHPEKVLGQKRVKMIQTLDQRLEEIQKFEVQAALIISFDRGFSNLPAGEFVKKIIVNHLKAKMVVVGENFRFGKDRQGDKHLLREMAPRFDLQVFSLPSVTKKDITVSSSIIRKYIQEGQIEKANLLLGRNYEMRGEVIKGKSRGKTIGFPTANVKTYNEIAPPGVFVTEFEIDSETLPSVTNIGSCPTFDQQEINIESYIIDFKRNLYGKSIKIHFFKKIREETKFAAPQDLSDQIRRDIKTAKKFFRKT